jgi:6-phosphogluconolactonase
VVAEGTSLLPNIFARLEKFEPRLLRIHVGSELGIFMGKYEVLRFSDAEQLAQAAAVRWLETLSGATKQKAFLVALSGGRIARIFSSASASLAKSRKGLFESVHFFWGDERCVAPEDPESNFRIAQELLFGPLDIPGNQIHRIHGEEPPEIAARTAEEELLKTAGARSEDVPILDLIFLGIGEDGHTASLFPGEKLPSGKEPVYRHVRGSKPPPDRITLGYSTISAAKDVWVLASGPGKEEALHNSLQQDALTPLGRVVRERERTLFLTDIRL